MVSKEVVAAGAGIAVAGAAAVAYKLSASTNGSSSSKMASSNPSWNTPYFSCVVFLDASGGIAPHGKTLRWPRHGPICDMLAAVTALLEIEGPAR